MVKAKSEESNVAVEEAPKRAAKRRVKKATKKVTAKSVKKAPAKTKKVVSKATAKPTAKKGKEKVDKGEYGTPESVVKATLAYFIANPGTTRTSARQETENKNLGLPWLIENGHVIQETEEGVRGYVFKVSASGKRLVKKLKS